MIISTNIHSVPGDEAMEFFNIINLLLTLLPMRFKTLLCSPFSLSPDVNVLDFAYHIQAN